MRDSEKPIRHSISLPPRVARRVKALARTKKTSANRVVVDLIEAWSMGSRGSVSLPPAIQRRSSWLLPRRVCLPLNTFALLWLPTLSALASRPLRSVHLGDELAKLRRGRWRKPVHPAAETLLADRSDLVHGDLRPPTRTRALDAAAPARVTSRGERADDNGIEVAVHRVEAYHDHGPGLRDLAATGPIEVGRIDAVTLDRLARQGSLSRPSFRVPSRSLQSESTG